MSWSYGPILVMGDLASKSNSRQLVRFGSRPAFIKSAKARGYVDDFLRQVRRPKEAYAGPVALFADVHYASRRPDLDISLLQDAIQAAGLIKNDRQVVQIFTAKFLDPGKPRVFFYLEAIEAPRSVVHQPPLDEREAHPVGWTSLFDTLSM